jgi:thiamine biosynthesis lipoprotein
MTGAAVPQFNEAALSTATWTDWSCLVRLVVTDPAALAPATADLTAMMRRVELAASRFRADSELNWANDNAGRPVAVSRTLINLIDTALVAARLTLGAVDPTLGRDLTRIGYDRDISLVIGAPDDLVAPELRRRRTDWHDVKLDRQMGLLTVPVGAALDLGATAKAQTADWAAKDLAERYGCDVLVEIGGDLAVAGSKRDWQITVAERAGGSGQQISLGVADGTGGVATSTTTVRHWRRGGQDQHHLIDPATGLPVQGHWRTVSVGAGSAVQANTCSTAAIVLGAIDARAATEWLASQHVAARLVGTAGQVITLGGWPTDPAESVASSPASRTELSSW